MAYALDRRALFDWQGHFDPNRYLEVFEKIKLKPGFALDYVFRWTGLGGQPLLYSRKSKEPRLPSIEAFEKKYRDTNHHLFEHLSFEESPEGYFQFALFCLMAPRFYLVWHDNYADLEFVCSAEKLESILSNIRSVATHRLEVMRIISEEDKQKLRSLDLQPRVILHSRSAKVIALSFTNWGGFAFHHSFIRPPNRLDQTSREQLVKYDCGIRI